MTAHSDSHNPPGLDQFVHLLDEAVSFAADQKIPVYYVHTIFQFFAQRQMNILVDKAIELTDAQLNHGTHTQEIRQAGINPELPFRIIRSPEEFAELFHGKQISHPGFSLPIGGRFQGTDLSREFESGQCSNCPNGGPTVCPNNCPSKDYLPDPSGN